MQQDIEDNGNIGMPQKVFGYGEMAGARNRKKFGNTLNGAEKNCLYNRHISSFAEDFENFFISI